MRAEREGQCIVDTSALLALLLKEPGAEVVLDHMRQSSCIITLVNYCEVLTKLFELTFPIDEFDAVFSALPLTLVEVNREMARFAAALRPSTKHIGLSLGDRFCIACAFYYKGTALTADKCWKSIEVGVPIEFIR